MTTWVRLAAAFAIALAVAGCQKTGAVDQARLEAPAPDEWLSYGRTYDEQRFSPLRQIDRASVGKLGLAWWTEFDTDRGQEATPLIADGVLYTTTAWSKVHAFDAKTGKAIWAYDPKVPGEKGFYACCDVVNRGVAIWGGKVFVGTLDGRLIALDAKSGKPVWSVQTTDPERPYTITGAPRVVKGKVLIGNGGAELGVRGYITAYDAETGKQAWRFFTTPNPDGKPDGAASDPIMARSAAATWFGDGWKATGGGERVWDAIAYDPKLDILYVGVGNGSPWDRERRSDGKGDNLFLSSILALKPDTGAYVWHYQTTPGDSWDYTATQHIMLADLTIAGARRRVVMQAPKNGFFYVLDAADGKLIAADKYVPVDWAERVDIATGRPVEAAFARYNTGSKDVTLVSGPGGGHNWQPMAFSPRTGLVYIPAMVSPGYFAQARDFVFRPGGQNTSMQRPYTGPNAPKPAPSTRPPAHGELVAWDPVAKAARWRIRMPQSSTGGLLATDGGLIFHAEQNRFLARDAASGAELWAYDTVAYAIAAPATYEIDGEQYVALMVGYGGIGGLGGNQPRRRGRLLVFRLGATAHQGPYPEPVVLPPLDLSAAEASTGDADRGGMLFSANCITCHRGGVFLPNLPTSPAILRADGFKAIVLGGALQDTGMASFRRLLTPAEVEDLRAFLLWSAKTAPRAPPRPAAPARVEH